MSIILGGRRLEVPCVETLCPADDAKLEWATDTNARPQPPQAIVLHTTSGKRGLLRKGIRPSKRAEAYAHYQAHTPRNVSWDFTIDTDGTVVQSNDPLIRATWQAGNSAINNRTLGIELVQDGDGAVYEGQLGAMVLFLDALTRELGIQRQVPTLNGQPDSRKLGRLFGGNAGASVYGIYGHRNCAHDRGFGDPGDHPFAALLAAGYEGFDLEAGEDVGVWGERQRALGFDAAERDGKPGRKTRAALAAAGHAHGLWVGRP